MSTEELPEEHRMLVELVQKFVQNELMPLEAVVLEREARGEPAALTAEELAPLLARCRELDLWGLDVPKEYGGWDIGAVAKMAVCEELARTIVPFTFPPDSPNLHMLIATVNEEQREKYLVPYARGESISAIAISEPGAGSDPASMQTRAERRGDEWVLNGRKIWISRAAEADFTIVIAVTEAGKGARGGISAFIVDRGTPGMLVGAPEPILGGARTHEVIFEDCRIPAANLLGQLGNGFGPMQLRLTVRRLEMGAWSIGIASRALDMLMRHAVSRVTFGQKLAERQSIQWWIADAATDIHAARLMVRDAASKVEAGKDVRVEASMVKVFATEMAQRVTDQAIQAYGAMGLTKRMPLQALYQKARMMRIVEGASEIHRWVLARSLLRNVS